MVLSSKAKYVLTYVDDKQSILKLTKCNFCPFLINDIDNSQTRCGKFINTKGNSNFLKQIYGYVYKGGKFNYMIPSNDIDIPKWCGLSELVSNVDKSILHFNKNGFQMLKTIQEKSFNFVMDENVIFSCDNETLITKYTNNTVKNNTNYVKQHAVCSNCGEQEKSVNRDKHNGVCEKCWNKIKNDNEKIKNSYINNFRLKRKATWENKKFKII